MERLIDMARELLKSGESAIVIFTDGRDFNRNRDGSGQTGNWVIDPKRLFEKVIVYRRDKVFGKNEVYAATPVGVIGPIHLTKSKQDRYAIKLSSVKLEGTTSEKWFSFAQTGPNPIRYLTKP